MPRVKEAPKESPKKEQPALKEKSKKKQQAEANLPVVYEKLEIKLYDDEQPLTVEVAKQLLGWEQETDEIKFGQDYTLTDENDLKIRCRNNSRNRPFDEQHSRQLAQDMLNHHWRFNGETIVVGRCGSVISGQHRLIGLVLAEQRRTSDHESPSGETYADHYKQAWKAPVTIQALVVLGVDESPETLRTLDNVRPRTLADVLYTQNTFARFKNKERAILCRMLDYAVRLLWQRTGAYDDPYSPKRTHSEALDFIERHKKVAEAVKHIYEENDKSNGIGKILSPGSAAGLLYLMGACSSGGEPYHAEPHPSEKLVDFEHWDKAAEFWVELNAASLGAGGKRLAAVIEALGKVGDATETPEQPRSPRETAAILIKAWHRFMAGSKVTLETIMPKTAKDEDGNRVLDETCLVGGIDLGDMKKREAAEEADSEEEEEEDEAPKPKKLKKGEVSDMQPAHERKSDEPAMSAREEIDALKARFPDHNVVQRDDMGSLTVYGLDAEVIAKQTRATIKRHQGTARIILRAKDEEEIAEKLTGAGVPFVIVERGKKGWEIASANPAIKESKVETNGSAKAAKTAKTTEPVGDSPEKAPAKAGKK
jgi:hypothetical protein